VRFFAGVPLQATGGVTVGVGALIDARPRTIHAEDLIILEFFGRRGSALLQTLALGAGEADLPGRFGPGVLVRNAFETTLDAELRLLARVGGSIELAIVELDDTRGLAEAMRCSTVRERLAAGIFGPTRAALYKRDGASLAAAHVDGVLRELGARTRVRTVGRAALVGQRVPLLSGYELLHLAELAFDQVQHQGGAQRLVLQPQ
jgi:hypothetical protein